MPPIRARQGKCTVSYPASKNRACCQRFMSERGRTETLLVVGKDNSHIRVKPKGEMKVSVVGCSHSSETPAVVSRERWHEGNE